MAQARGEGRHPAAWGGAAWWGRALWDFYLILFRQPDPSPNLPAVCIPSLRTLIKDSFSPYSQKLCLKVQGCQQRCVITQHQHNPRKIPISTLNKRGVKRQEDKFPRSGPFHCKSTLISFRLHLTCAYEACGNKNWNLITHRARMKDDKVFMIENGKEINCLFCGVNRINWVLPKF